MANLLRPRLTVERPLRLYEEPAEPPSEEAAEETLHSFLQLDFEPSQDVQFH